MYHEVISAHRVLPLGWEWLRYGSVYEVLLEPSRFTSLILEMLSPLSHLSKISLRDAGEATLFEVFQSILDSGPWWVGYWDTLFPREVLSFHTQSGHFIYRVCTKWHYEPPEFKWVSCSERCSVSFALLVGPPCAGAILKRPWRQRCLAVCGWDDELENLQTCKQSGERNGGLFVKIRLQLEEGSRVISGSW